MQDWTEISRRPESCTSNFPSSRLDTFGLIIIFCIRTGTIQLSVIKKKFVSRLTVGSIIQACFSTPSLATHLSIEHRQRSQFIENLSIDIELPFCTTGFPIQLEEAAAGNWTPLFCVHNGANPMKNSYWFFTTVFTSKLKSNNVKCFCPFLVVFSRKIRLIN